MNTLNEEIIRLETAKANIDRVLIERGVSIPANATLDTYHNLINSIKGGISSSEVTATRANVLAGTYTVTADSNDEIVEGTMEHVIMQHRRLNVGESHTIREGYYDGTNKVIANSLASQFGDYVYKRTQIELVVETPFSIGRNFMIPVAECTLTENDFLILSANNSYDEPFSVCLSLDSYNIRTNYYYILFSDGELLMARANDSTTPPDITSLAVYKYEKI